jgi:hypothetical protein
MVLSLEAQVLMVEHTFICGGEHTEEVKQKFAEMFPESQAPHHHTVQQKICKFRETISVADMLRSAGHEC